MGVASVHALELLWGRCGIVREERIGRRGGGGGGGRLHDAYVAEPLMELEPDIIIILTAPPSSRCTVAVAKERGRHL